MKSSSNQKQTSKPAVLAIALAASLNLFQTTAQAAQRPLSDFLSRQGAYCIQLDANGNYDCAAGTYGGGSSCFLYVPPFPNYLDWTDPVNQSSVSFDYAGIVNAALGNRFNTTTTGSISELPQADGSVIVTVLLHTHNALTWATTGFGATGTDLFGHTSAEVAAGAQPAIGSCNLKVVLHGPAPGAPLPDLIELLGGCGPWSFMSVDFDGQASGPLPNGAAGRLQVIQTGLVTTAGLANSNSRVALDAFPAEQITIQAAGN
jgi:uncharacterized membrane protein